MRLERMAPLWVRIRFRDTGMGIDANAASQNFRATAVQLRGRHRSRSGNRLSDRAGAQRAHLVSSEKDRGAEFIVELATRGLKRACNAIESSPDTGKTAVHGSYLRRGRRALHLRAAGNYFSQGGAPRRSGQQRGSRAPQARIARSSTSSSPTFACPAQRAWICSSITKEISPSTIFILITGVPTVETAIAALNAGADRYVIKDHDLVDQLRRAVQQVDETLQTKKRGWLSSPRTSPPHRPGQHHRPQPENARDF